jgi:TolB-like protein/Flp pilus assembly protein TadD
VTPDRSRQIQELFHSVRTAEPATREALLQQADPDLRREVELLLSPPITQTCDPAVTFAGPGYEFGPYRVECRIGTGGMGEVFQATDTRLGRSVAIKVSSAVFSDRFAREARAISSLNHPNICTLYDVGPNYLVMELVEGETLADRLKRGKLPMEDVVRDASQIADALAEAHAHGIVHRDLKPHNVMLTRHGVKLLDFGIAKVFTEVDDAMTQAGAVMGTPLYMAPEQWEGKSAGAPSDLFSLGLVTYEMAIGQLPVPGASLGKLMRSGTPTIQAPSKVQPGASTKFDTLVNRLLKANPAERPAGAAAVRDELRNMAPHPRGPLYVALGVGVAAALAAAAFWLNAGGVKDRITGGSGAQIRSIAVLPLENLSKDPAQEYFADGTTDAIITDLSKMGALKVISLKSSLQYRGSKKSVRDIGRELKVDAVVEGAMMQADGKVRISARLTRASTETPLWAQDYLRDLKDVLTLQDDLAQEIAGAIRLKLTPDEKKSLTEGAVDPEAYRLYLQAQYAFNQDDVQLRRQAVQMFEQVTQKDPKYARGWAGLALANAGLGRFYNEPRIVMPKAKAAALKAIEIDETLSEAHTALATVLLQYEWDWQGAETELKRAIQLNRSSADAHDLYAAYYTALGNFPSALSEIQLSREFDPLSLRYADRYLYVLVFSKDYDHAITEADKILATDKNFVMGWAWRAMALTMLGRFDEAIESQNRAIAIENNPGMQIFMGVMQAARGNKAAARQIAADIEAQEKQQYVCNYEIAQVYVMLGDRDKAMKWLKSGINQQCDCMIWLQGEPWMEKIRTDPGYLDLIKRVGFDHQPGAAHR